MPDHQAAGMLSMGRSTFWREVKAGKLPQPIKIGGLTRWRVADLRRFSNQPDPALKEDPTSAIATRETNIPKRDEMIKLPPPSMFLSPAEIAELTGVRAGRRGSVKATLQIQALLQMRVPHYVNPQGGILVPRAAVERGETVPACAAYSRPFDLSKVR